MTARLRIGWIPALAALCCLSLSSGCADGGVGGTGISTVQGNIIEVSTASDNRQARPPVLSGRGPDEAGVTVREPVTGVEDRTDNRGEFHLEGRFPVDTTLLFFTAGNDGTPATAELVVAPGSEVTLEDVRIAAQRAEPSIVRTVLPPGVVVDDATCVAEDGSFWMQSGDLTFTVLLDAATSFKKGERGCGDLTQGAEVQVRGVQNGFEVTATEIKINRSGRLPTD